MSGIGKFKLTDALPKNQAESPGDAGPESLGGKGAGKAKPRSKKAKTGKAEAGPSAGASTRGHMVDIGRGNQQAGRQKAK
jgi:hypothetical protein